MAPTSRRRRKSSAFISIRRVSPSLVLTLRTSRRVHRARAFMLEPLTPKGIYSMDGERAEYSPLRCEVHKQVLTLLG